MVARRHADRVHPPPRRRGRRQDAEPRRVRHRRASGAQPRRLTTTTAEESGRLAWSPDGKHDRVPARRRAEVSPPTTRTQLAVIPAAGGAAAHPDRALDRPVTSPSLVGRRPIADLRRRRRSRAARRAGCRPRAGASRRLIERPAGRHRIPSAGADGSFAVLASTATELPEVHALEGGKLRQLTQQNDDWLKDVQLGTTEDFTSTSKDGTEVHGLIVKPAELRRRRASIRRCCASTAARTARTSTRSASSASCSPPTATSWSR